MNFADDITACILHSLPNAVILPGKLLGKTLHLPDRNLLFHLLPIPPHPEPSAGFHPAYFQEQSLAYASRGIQLVHLWQDVWTSRREIVRSRIAALLGCGARIHARQTAVQRISKDVASRFFTTNHLQGYVSARYHYGLHLGGKCVAAASFSAGRTILRDGLSGRSFELLRYAGLLNHRVTGGLGKLIARFISDLRPADLMTYADLDWASGKSYRTLGFKQTNLTPPQSFWVHPDAMLRYYPHRLPACLAQAYDSQPHPRILDDFLKSRGYIRIYNAGNLKYLLVTEHKPATLPPPTVIMAEK